MKVGEIGRRIYFAARFDMSAAIGGVVEATLIKPDNTTLVVSAAVQVSPEGSYLANEFATYDTQSGDIDQAGAWQAYIKYTDASPKEYFSDRATFTVSSV